MKKGILKTQIKNSSSAILYQLVTVLIGLILPGIMIRAYGSSVYGLGTSITQFLSYIALIEGGTGGVVRVALYKAFAINDDRKISAIIKASDIFFRKVSGAFIVYIAVLSLIYPRYINSSFDAVSTGSLICIIAISSLSQYCFGLTYNLFLVADQKNYVVNVVQIITYIFNAVLTIILINFGVSFHIVKLVGALIYVLRPLCFRMYVNRNYNIIHKIGPDHNALSQRWNAMAHHVAWFLHTNTDIVIITLFGTLSDVSVYSVYYLVANGMSKVAGALVSGAEALFGNMIASEGEDVAKTKFDYYSMFMNSIIIVLFSTATCMIMSFVSLYTRGITDANYHVPALGFLLLLAEGFYCIRIPYAGIVTASGQFKQTKMSAILEAFINIVLSSILIRYLGLPGVALATAIAMLYRTVYYIDFLSKNVLRISFWQNIIRVIAAIVVVVSIGVLKQLVFNFTVTSYYQWIFHAVVCICFSCVVCVVYVMLFYKKEINNLWYRIRILKKIQ